MRALILLCALTAPALAEPDIHVLAQTNGQWVVSPPELAKDLNARLAADLLLRPIRPDTNKPVATWACHTGFMTDAFVSWHCEGDFSPYGGPRTGAGIHRAFLIRAGKLVPFDLFAELTSKDALTAAFKRHYRGTKCEVTSDTALDDHGITFYSTAGAVPICTLPWSDGYSALRADSVVAQIVRMTPRTFWEQSFLTPANDIYYAKDLPAASTAKTAATRFVAEGDYGVRDTQTGLIWTAKQDPTEVTHRGAEAIAAAYRGGGHSDWRLPTIQELAAIATPDLAHTEPGDCTKGKSRYAITPMIHLSCGLAWSLTPLKDTPGQYAAFGFISGTARLADFNEKKNYRALLVRSP